MVGIQIRRCARRIHEIFHPPFDSNNPALQAATKRLRADPLIQNIAAKSNPAFGYATFDSILDEDSTQALDMNLSNKLGVKREPGEYWRHQDDGMHLFAAAIYDAMKETGFAETGGIYEAWLIEALNRRDFITSSSGTAGSFCFGRWRRR